MHVYTHQNLNITSVYDIPIHPSCVSSIHYHIISGWWLQPIWKNISQDGNLPQIGVKIKNVWNHHLDLFRAVPLYHHQASVNCQSSRQKGRAMGPAVLQGSSGGTSQTFSMLNVTWMVVTMVMAQVTLPSQWCLLLVGGLFQPICRICASQIGSFPQGSGWK